MKKKTILTILCTLCAAVIIIGVAIFAQNQKIKNDDTTNYGKYKSDNPVLLVAHRGYSDLAPENTVAAFRAAGESGAFYGAECDVQLTSDNVWVVIHDDTVERTTNGKGKVCDYSLEELEALRVDTGSGINEYPDEKVPTLQQFLNICKQYNMRPFIEIKMDASFEQVKSLYDILTANGLAEGSTIISFNYDSLKYMREIDENIEIYALISKITDKVTEMCIENNFGIDFSHSEKKNTIAKINELHEKGISLAAWTIKDESSYIRMVDNGVVLITCNAPE